MLSGLVELPHQTRGLQLGGLQGLGRGRFVINKQQIIIFSIRGSSGSRLLHDSGKNGVPLDKPHALTHRGRWGRGRCTGSRGTQFITGGVLGLRSGALRRDR